VGGDGALLEFRDPAGHAEEVLRHRKRSLGRIHPVEGYNVALGRSALRVRMEQAGPGAPRQDRIFVAEMNVDRLWRGRVAAATMGPTR